MLGGVFCGKWISDKQRRLCGKGVRVMEETKKLETNSILNLNFSVLVTTEDIDDIMVSALEGGITYWANRAKVPEEKRVAEWGHEQIARDGELHIHVVEPFDQDDTEWYILTKEKFMEGLKRWLEVPGTELIPLPHGERLGVDTSQIDGAAADEIIQYALFGEVVYG